MSSPPLDAPRRDGRAPSSATVATAFRDLAGRLRGAELPTPELDARLLVCEACGLDLETFMADPDRRLDAGEIRRLSVLTDRRLAREPVSRILARRAFWQAEFHLSDETLDPRPDTETVVECALEAASAWPAPTILDLGTGTGCILLSLLAELPDATGIGTDLSPGALAVARRNAMRLGLGGRAGFVCVDWFAGLAGTFDLVVANPPYIPSAEIGDLAPEVALYEPRAALDGGADGLDAFRAIGRDIRRVLRPGGWLIVEVGAGQADAVVGLMARHGLGSEPDGRRRRRDLSGVVRCVAARRI
ncbi:MAG: peptide chain release factor N(5)-glutamine methyltransferase [Hyphomicrobiales bacterium]|nr:peptide chain release factor N(5)-glutamine methyltransferase [Hyphomicrobiales bacterium]